MDNWRYRHQLSGRSYHSEDEAFEACSKDEKCTGFFSAGNTNFYLGKGHDLIPRVNTHSYKKEGEFQVYHGFTWTEITGWHWEIIIDDKFKEQEEALNKCNSMDNCKGIVFIDGYYRITGGDHKVIDKKIKMIQRTSMICLFIVTSTGDKYEVC